MRSEVNGSVNMRSFLAGNPCIKIAVNEDLIINQDKSSSGKRNAGHVCWHVLALHINQT